MLNWAQRRKFIVFAVFLSLALGAAIFFILSVWEQAPSIPPEAQKLSVLWTRFFEMRDGFVDAAALIENPNNVVAEKITYSFKIYDKNNILIAIKEGETFANPLEKFVIFEPNIGVSERIPGRIVIDIKDIIFKQDFTDSRPKIDILGTKRFLEDVFPRILLSIKNREETSLENIQSIIVLFDENRNAVAVSRTQIPFLVIGEERLLTFTWPRALNGVSSIEIFFR